MIEFSDFPKIEIQVETLHQVGNTRSLKFKRWKVYVNGANNFKKVSIKVVIFNLEGDCFKYFIG